MSHGSLPPPPSTDGKSTLLSSAAHKPDNADGGASEAEAYSKSYHVRIRLFWTKHSRIKTDSLSFQI